MVANTAPQAYDDVVLAAEDGVPIDLNVLANDLGTGRTLVAVNSDGLQGSVSWAANGRVTYDPDEAFQELAVGQSAVTTFTYTMRDASGLTSSATVAVTVAGYNDAPAAQDDYFEVAEKASITFDVLANDRDVDAGDTLTLVSVSSSHAGSTVRIVDGKVAYTADSALFDPLKTGEAAVDSFTYTMRDAQGAVSTATVTVGVLGVGGGASGGGQAGGPGADILGTRKADVLNGTLYDELINGREGDDCLNGLGGGDRLLGGVGDDRLYGGAGIDELLGENGDDRLYGEADDDELDGGQGDDRLDGGIGSDLLLGGKGNDRLDGGAGDDWLEGGAGKDRFVFSGKFGHDTIFDFNSRDDTIQFDWQMLLKLGSVRLHQDGADFVISVGDHSSITLADIGVCDLRLSDFTFG